MGKGGIDDDGWMLRPSVRPSCPMEGRREVGESGEERELFCFNATDGFPSASGTDRIRALALYGPRLTTF